MKRISENKIVALLLAFVLCMTLLFTGCKNNEESPDGDATTTQDAIDAVLPAIWQNATYTENTTLGEGAKQVAVHVTAADKTIVLTLKTDAANLGDALLELKVAEGQDGQYGLFIESVNGIKSNYDVDATWWAFNKINEDGSAEMMNVGVSACEIKGGETFELKLTK